MIRTAVFAATVAAAVVACGGAPLRAQQFIGPDGSPGWWHLDCPRTFGDCFRGAGVRCPDGWSDERENESHGFIAGSYSNAGAGVSSSFSRTMTDRSLTIHCKGRSYDPTPKCGADFETHRCQGSSRWVPETMSCEPC